LVLICALTIHIYLNQRGFSTVFAEYNLARRGAWGKKDSDKIFLVIFGEFIYKSQKLLE